MFGLRFSARVHAALASGALTLAGCFTDNGLAGPASTAEPTTATSTSTTTTSGAEPTSEPDTTGPATSTMTTTGEGPGVTDSDGAGPPLLQSVELDGDRLILTFTEPLAPIADVSPTQFRLSAAIVSDKQVTYYYDPSAWNFECYGSDTGMQYCYDGPLTFEDLDDGVDPEVLQLEFATDILENTCVELAARAVMLGGEGALYLHFSDAQGSKIYDKDGEALAPFGADWIGAGDSMTVDGELPALVPRLPIPCVPD
ncbi:hypothetical protein [Nannocystis radixulma]|uniref:Lipoprotein n=1 Tax=Nannocystis radixulma TaxID=2995305 RepID=A0ABT5BA58_9BACT|nr:hypothetical protein [Nannocystis radixulma]MDC0671026.1 hypothetical protein [Nannocystis radixulma]